MEDDQPGANSGGLQPAAMRALGIANTAIGQYRATGNPLFLWEAIKAITSPALAGQPLVLGEEVRSYLHAAASDISTAGISPVERFKDSVLKALLFSDSTNGKSVPKEFARLESAANFLGIYLALRNRHKSDRAQAMIAERLGITHSRVKARITEARNDLKRMMLANGETIPSDDELGNPGMNGLPDIVLMTLLDGLPSVVWGNPKFRNRKIG